MAYKNKEKDRAYNLQWQRTHKDKIKAYNRMPNALFMKNKKEPAWADQKKWDKQYSEPKIEGWVEEFEELMPKTSDEPISYPQFCAIRNFICQLLKEQREELGEKHNTQDGYCCACEYDIATFEGRLKDNVEHCSEPNCPECNKVAYERGREEMKGKLSYLKQHLESYLNYCQQKNGRDSCKNCGLEQEDLELLNELLK
jgi:hypothetical protein